VSIEQGLKFGVPRFTLGRLMVLVTATACCLGMFRLLGLVLGTLFVTLMLCYLLASFLSNRNRAICLACCLFFALLPWLDLGHGSFVAMGATDRLLPTISLPSVIRTPLSAFYFVAETPLYFVAEYSYHLADVITFAGEGVVTVRPYVVFVFWLGLAVAFGLSIGTSLVARWRSEDFGHPRGLPNI
jgi:hypothetical protein